MLLEQCIWRVTVNIGQLITFLILNSTKSNKEILETIHSKFPGCKTSPACIAWYKTKLRKEGKLAAKEAGKFHVELSEEELAELAK
jgi:hypothetical protein